MVDTVRTLAALQALLADNTAGDISAQDMRDFLVSVYPPSSDSPQRSATETSWCVPGTHLGASGTVGRGAGFTYYEPVAVQRDLTLTEVSFEVTTSQSGSVGRVALIEADEFWQPTDLVEDFGTATTASTGVKTITSIDLDVPAGRYLFGFRHSHASGTVTVRQYAGCTPSFGLNPSLGTNGMAIHLFVAEAYGAFAATPTDWSGVSWSNTGGFNYFVFGRWTDPLS